MVIEEGLNQLPFTEYTVQTHTGELDRSIHGSQFSDIHDKPDILMITFSLAQKKLYAHSVLVY